ncbi:scavenger receptor cysteine-rich type 1 protein M130-like [Scomber scombrus]|uniref:Scavenger receptor cysteine-rich type 1 protein M130-like n=1 Tax=Scomber scombrus TaxID=13677 RepID=A0AAV1QHK1_SCOSC
MDHLLMLLLLLWSSGFQCDSKADIVMLVDESGSISPEDFSMMKSFLREIVNNVDIGPDKVQIGNILLLLQFTPLLLLL